MIIDQVLIYDTHLKVPTPHSDVYSILYKLSTDGLLYLKTKDGISTAVGGGSSPSPVTLQKVTVPYSDFILNQLTGTGIKSIATSPGAVVNIIKIKHSISFAAPLLFDAYLNISSGSRYKYTNDKISVFVPVGNTVGHEGLYAGENTLKTIPIPPLPGASPGGGIEGVILNHITPDVLIVELTTSGDEIANLTAGSVDIWYTETICV